MPDCSLPLTALSEADERSGKDLHIRIKTLCRMLDTYDHIILMQISSVCFGCQPTNEVAQLKSLRIVATRIQSVYVSLGNLGDHKFVGDSVWEMREAFGPGWRMYYVLQGSAVVMMLGGGEKSSQVKDIERAKALAQELRNEQDQDPSV